MADKLINELDTELAFSDLAVSDLLAVRDVSGNLTAKAQLQSVVKRGLNGSVLTDLGNVADSATPDLDVLLVGDGSQWIKITSEDLLFLLLPTLTGNANEVLTVNPTADGVLWAPGGGSGSSLPDYVGNANKALFVNNDEDDVEWIAAGKLDVANTWTAGQHGAIFALTDGATITPDMAEANFFSVTLGGNRTLANPSNLVAGQSGSIFITQDGTGSRTLAYGSYWDFAGGAAPVLSTAINTVDRLDYVVRTTTSIHAVLTKAWS